MSRLLTREKANPRNWFDGGPMVSLREEMDDLIENFFGDSGMSTSTGVVVPRLDVSETSDTVQIKTDLPGVKPEDVSIDIRENHMTISGQHTEEKETKSDKDRKYHRIERRQGRFSRSVWLPCAVEQDGVEAELKDGVLTVTLPKAEEARSRKICVKGK